MTFQEKETAPLPLLSPGFSKFFAPSQKVSQGGRGLLSDLLGDPGFEVLHKGLPFFGVRVKAVVPEEGKRSRTFPGEKPCPQGAVARAFGETLRAPDLVPPEVGQRPCRALDPPVSLLKGKSFHKGGDP